MNRTQRLATLGSARLLHCVALVMVVLFSASLFAQEEIMAEKDDPDGAMSAQENPAMDTQRPLISTGLSSEAIARNNPDSAVWLSIDDQSRVLALFQPETESPAKGALVILADEGVSAASGLADAIRQPLSKAGWAVMTLGLEAPSLSLQQWLRRRANAPAHSGDSPAQKQAEGMAGEMTDENESSVINMMARATPRDTLTAYRDRVLASVTAAVDALEKREYDRIVLAGIGRAAGHVTRQARADGRASDLVWIAPHFYSDESEGLAELLGSATSPSVLELYSTFPGDDTLDRAAQERASALERAGITGFQRQPVAMARRPQAREAHKLSNRISGWLRATGEKR